MEKFLTTQGVAERLEVSKRTVFRYLEAGKIRAAKIGQWRFREEDVQSFIAKNSNLPLKFKKQSKFSNSAENKLQIQSRRFLGNKAKLLGFINDIVVDKCGEISSFCDIFAGTGVVGNHFNKPEVKIITNDTLYSSYVPLMAWLGTTEYNPTRIKGIINNLNNLKPSGENYVSKNFGGSYFTVWNAKKIGAIREKIERLKISLSERYILLTSLLYAIDKVANTVGHYDAFRRKLDTTMPLKLLLPDIHPENNYENEICQENANKLIKRVKCDVLYIDPPYNSRQYIDSYHLLENIMRWEKPSVEGVAKKMVNRDYFKSDYCTRTAPEVFEDLIRSARVKHILLSYNNTGEKRNARSNACISDKQIIDTLDKRGPVEVFEKEYKSFTAGKSKTIGHTERVFYCKVTK